MTPASRDNLPPAPSVISAPILLTLCLLLTLIVASFVSLPLKFSELFSDDALKSACEFLQGFAPPDLSVPLLKKV
ncbi:MAG: phosphonate ABC transporter, permease protein PhnE, partial [Undibacterium sp.]|nr:phosphonate ABC transporter, permease protein PhnE [Undibacterium sp.]